MTVANAAQQTCRRHREEKRVAAVRAWALAGLAGLAFALSQPVFLTGTVFPGASEAILPSSSGALVFVCFVPLVAACAKKSVGHAFALAFFAMSIRNAVLVSWAWGALEASNVTPSVSGIVFAAMVALMSLLAAAPFGLAAFVDDKLSLSSVITTPIFFAAGEFVLDRAPFGGFPWTTASHALAPLTLWAQSAALYGVYGLSFVIVVVNCLLAALLLSRRRGRKLALAAAIVAIFTLLASYGSQRLRPGDEVNTGANSETMRVGLLSGAVDASLHQRSRQQRSQVARRYRHLQTQAEEQGASLIVWPELSLQAPVILREQLSHDDNVPPLLAHGLTAPPLPAGPAQERKPRGIRQKEKRNYVTIAGGSTVEYRSAAQAPALFNSVYVIGEQAEVIARVDKRHLVPFVERAVSGQSSPLFPPGLHAGNDASAIAFEIPRKSEVAIAEVDGDKSNDSAKQKVRAGILICYESLFPEISRKLTLDGAEILVEVSNDAWFGARAGPHQHLSQAIFRAIENARPVVRAVNLGLSAHIDARGRVLAVAPSTSPIALVVDVELSSQRTLATRWGQWLARLCLLAGALLLLLALARQAQAIVRGALAALLKNGDSLLSSRAAPERSGKY